MTTLTLEREPLATRVECTDDALTIYLDDGRRLSVPLDWYPRLAFGTPEERANYELFADGHAIHWPDLDEDLHVPGLLAGRRSGESERSFERWRAAMTQRRQETHPEPWGRVVPE